MFNQALGFFDDHLGDLDVACCGLVEGAGDNFSADTALHVGDFFRTLIYEQNNEDDFRVVCGDRVGDRLQEHGLTGARGSDNQAALPLAHGG